MNNTTITIYVITISLAFFVMAPLIGIIAKAYDDGVERGADIYDQYTVVDGIGDSYGLWILLKENGFIANDLSYGEFDYICVLTQQLCWMTRHVKPEVALAMIAVESNFDRDAKNGNARGLLQLIPYYHFERMGNFVEDGHMMTADDFFSPRLNIATGLDYMDSILDSTDGDLAYSLMWYNQGPSSASKSYLDDGHISGYAIAIINLSEDIRVCL